MQVDDEDLSDRSKERLRGFAAQDVLPIALLKQNAHIDPNQQIEVARRIRTEARSLHSYLAWRGLPDWNQLRKTCEIIFGEFVERPILMEYSQVRNSHFDLMKCGVPIASRDHLCNLAKR